MAGLAVLAGLFAVIAGCTGGWWYVKRCGESNRVASLRKASGAGDAAPRRTFVCKGVAAQVLRYATRIAAARQRRSEVRNEGCLVQALRRRLQVAGLGDCAWEAWAEASLRMAGCAGLVGVLVGGVVSLPMAGFLGVTLCLCGLSAPWWAAGKEGQARTDSLSEQLPEMLEVVCLGLRSGLSFERSFALYPAYFQGVLAEGCAWAIRQWESGLKSRDEALDALTEGYDSTLFRHAMQGVRRSLRLGTSLASDLQQVAEEARKQYRAKKEEAVARAPIKMMVPIGVMILPAMLLLVLGPVILELIAGF